MAHSTTQANLTGERDNANNVILYKPNSDYWPMERHSVCLPTERHVNITQETSSIMSFASTILSTNGGMNKSSQALLGSKVEMVYGLLSMLGTHSKEDMSHKLLSMSTSPESCIAMRQSGCLPLLIQLLHPGDSEGCNKEMASRAAQALHNIVYSHPDDKKGRREARILRLLEQIGDYCTYLTDILTSVLGSDLYLEDDREKHPGPAIAALMKLSFDEEHRHAMCCLGGLHAIAQLIQVDHAAHGSTTADQYCITIRRYAGMALTNLTFGDGTNKALLCSFQGFMRALVAQLHSPSEDLRQVTASVLRNLSWRADTVSKESLRTVGAVTALMRCAMEAKKESTLKSILSALWNLSAHCSINKADICAVDGALVFLIEMLTYKSKCKTLAVVENAGGILRNISSQVAVREEYRFVLRQHHCLQILLQHLRSPSLTVVSNACGTLWNLSARCLQDQQLLWEMGAVSMLRNLVHSKHKMISMGSSAALKNLLSAYPADAHSLGDPKCSLGNTVPTLQVRKKRALEKELDVNLAETCDNIEPCISPSNVDKYTFTQRMYHSLGQTMGRSNSKDSITSTHSDSSFDRGHFAWYPPGLCYDIMKNNSESQQSKSSTRSGIPLHKSHLHPHSNRRSSKSKTISTSSYYCNLEETPDQPIDFSLKYSDEHSRQRNKDEIEKINENLLSGTLTHYAETDQPTNYNVHYTETEGSEFLKKGNKLDKNETNFYMTDINDDTVMTYCTEGTPYQTPCNFSNATSMSDLHHPAIQEEKVQVCETVSGNSTSDVPLHFIISVESPNCNQKEGKSVTFNNNTSQFTEETPLMFSRCSSLGSLSSFEQQSIHDDRSSIISDFSRHASGVVSPSDLPASPTQILSTSPRRLQIHESSIVTHNQFHKVSGIPEERLLDDVSEPHVHTVEEVSIETRLSSMTFNDDDANCTIFQNETPSKVSSTSFMFDFHDNDKPSIKNNKNNGQDEDDVLSACIKTGMHTKNHNKCHPTEINKKRGKPDGFENMQNGEIVINECNTGSAVLFCQIMTKEKEPVCGDCVESNVTDYISHSGSHLSSTQKHQAEKTSREDHQSILLQCIQSGKPKARQTSHFMPTVKDNYTSSCKSNVNTGFDQHCKFPCLSDTKMPILSDSSLDCPLVDHKLSFDQVKAYATEGTPINFSTSTSLSDLTLNTSQEQSGLYGISPQPITSSNDATTESTLRAFSYDDSISSLGLDVDDFKDACHVPEEVNSEPLDVKVRGDQEWTLYKEKDLLQQCINLGMPKSKYFEHSQKGNNDYQSRIPKTEQLSYVKDSSSDTYKGNTDEINMEIPSADETNEDITALSLSTFASDLEKSDFHGKSELQNQTCVTDGTVAPIPAAPRLESDEWTDTSPNSVSCPSFSMSGALESLCSTESKTVGHKIRKVVQVCQDSEGVTDTKPPSGMGSLSSLTASTTSASLSRKLFPVKAAQIARRAIANGSSSSSCNLDHIQPPSAMEEVDMESSMLSVASITSEVASNSEVLFGALMAEMYLREGAMKSSSGPSLSQSEGIEEVGPPSAYNEVTTETVEPGTDTIGSDTEMNTEEGDGEVEGDVPDLPSDGTKGNTPMASGGSSNDSTPKRCQRLTPKQRRQMTRDRFRTYVVSPQPHNMSHDIEQENQSHATVDSHNFETVFTSSHILNSKHAISKTKQTVREQNSNRQTDKCSQVNEPPYLGDYKLQIKQSRIHPEVLDTLKQGANFVISTLNNLNQIEVTEDQLLEYETISLVSNESDLEAAKIVHTGEFDTSGLLVSSSSPKPCRPRIVKHEELHSQELNHCEETGSPRGIRGRRKGIYQKSVISSASATPNISASKSVSVRPTRAFSLRQNSNSPKNINRGLSGNSDSTVCKLDCQNVSPNSKRQSSSQPILSHQHRTKDSLTTTALKQGASCRDYQYSLPSSRTRIPVLSPTSETKKASPRALPKTKHRRDTMQPSPFRPTLQSCNSLTAKLFRTNNQESKFKKSNVPVVATVKVGAVPKANCTMTCLKSSNSSQSLKGGGSTNSLNSISSQGSVAGNKRGKKEPVSKIANLWKRVEESRLKDKKGNSEMDDTLRRADSEGHRLNSTDKPLLSIPRSSTYEKISSGTKISKGKTKLSLRLSKFTTRSKKNGEVENKEDIWIQRQNGIAEYVKNETTDNSKPKRLSRLGSFMRLDSEESKKLKLPASAIVPPYNYSLPKLSSLLIKSDSHIMGMKVKSEATSIMVTTV